MRVFAIAISLFNFYLVMVSLFEEPVFPVGGYVVLGINCMFWMGVAILATLRKKEN